jgi:muramidase (phage lysozyme)
MGYSAVADTTDGDRGLTTSTVGEIVNKHGNKAIGIGQFKFNEFMKPTAKKWFGMSEAQLKDQMFTPQFQDALVVAGLYDAGLQQFADGKIDAATFQKRIANIWRGLPPNKDTKEGDPTDDLGNKARMSGEELRGLIEQGMTGQ